MQTVDFNDQITENIKDEMNQFEEISELVKVNIGSIEEIVKSTEKLNVIIEEVKSMLS